MEVLIYQVVIALLILAAGAFGKKARNVVTIIICLFTIIEVFTLKLAILQFVTIYLAYFFSIGYEKKTVKPKEHEFNYYVVDNKKIKNKKTHKEKSDSSFKVFSVFFIIVSSIIFTIYVFQNKNERKKEILEFKRDTVIPKKGRTIFKQNYTQENEIPVIEEVQDEITTPNGHIDDYLNDNFPNGNSKYYDAVSLRTTSFYTRYKELDESWGNWSEKNHLKTSIIIHTGRNKISILSQVTYRYSDYDIVRINDVRKKVNKNEWEFMCVDNDDIPCRIIHSISTADHLMSQVKILYSDEKILYNVIRED